VIDRTVPTVTVTSPASPTTALTFDYQLTFSESVTDLTTSDFTISGSSCAIGSVTGSGTQYIVRVQSCADGANAYLVMLPNSVSDAALNLGPASAPIFTTVAVDRSASAPTWASAVTTSYTSPSFVVDFTEALIGFTASDVSNTGTATGCVISMVSTTVTRYTITTTGCSLGSVQLSISQGAYADALGNTGPQTVSASSVTTVIAQPAPTPTPTPTPTPSPTPTASPTPTPTAAPVSSGSGGGSGGGGPSGSSGTSTPVTIQPPVELNTNSAANNMEIIAAQPVRKTYAFSSAIKLPTSPQEEPIAIYEPDAPQITVDNPTDGPPPVAPKNDWQQYAIIGVGSLSGLLATIGVIQGARQMRNRRLVKKFA
jgi:hypothetical protein